MGNRAVITDRQKKIGVYLHWNGGRESIETFLTYCRLKGYRAPEGDNYGWARLCQVIGNFLGGGLSIGIGCYDNLDCDNGDNGVYVIENWKVIDRIYEEEPAGWAMEEDQLLEFLEEVNKKMPVDEQIDVKLEYKKMKVVDRLYKLAELSEVDAEKAHSEADKLLIDYISSINSDREIDFAFSKIKKWYA